MRNLGKVIARGLGAVGLFALAACSPLQFGSRTLDFSGWDNSQPAPMQPASMPVGPAQSFGRGPVQVALLLPLTGDAGLAQVGQSLANASRLAIAFIEANPNIAENITISLRDTGGTVAGATRDTRTVTASFPFSSSLRDSTSVWR